MKRFELDDSAATTTPHPTFATVSENTIPQGFALVPVWNPWLAAAWAAQAALAAQATHALASPTLN